MLLQAEQGLTYSVQQSLVGVSLRCKRFELLEPPKAHRATAQP